MSERRGRLFIISGPAGAGKGTLRQELFRLVPGLAYSVSCTTRAPRPGERDGIDYHFVEERDFRRMIDEGAFLEWAEVHGRLYGTRQADVERELAEGISVVLEIDVQGCENVKARMPGAYTIFIAPPSLEALADRLRGRGTETEEQTELRLANAKGEMARAGEYDRVVVNDVVPRAAAELAQIVSDRL